LYKDRAISIKRRNLLYGFLSQLFLALFFVSSAYCVTLKYNGVSMDMQTTKPTNPALAVSFSGTVYYAPLMQASIPGRIHVNYNGAIYSVAKYTLYKNYSSDSGATSTAVNSCQSLTLPAGYYKVEVRGGTGGNGGSAAGAADAGVQTFSFNLSNDATAYIFRGGNGNDGGACGTGANSAGSGGGASGAASVLVVGSSVYKSEGGGGGKGSNARNNGSSDKGCGGGGGGNAGSASNGSGAYDNYAWSNDLFMCGAGGGGSPSGSGQGQSGSSSYGGGASGSGSASGGGKGGDAWRLLDTTTGGKGGASVTWSCGGATLYSYGGGGGGAIQSKAISTQNKNGCAGGSGSTGASTTSYVKIYRAE
jgi:hypothetical protein